MPLYKKVCRSVRQSFHPSFDKLDDQWNDLFLVATKRLYMRVCPSVGWSVGSSVPKQFFFRPTRSDACRVYGLVYSIRICLWIPSKASDVLCVPSGMLAQMFTCRRTGSLSERSHLVEVNYFFFSLSRAPVFNNTFNAIILMFAISVVRFWYRS